MPTDNIAVLEDPSLTLWTSVSPVFRGNAVAIRREDGGTVPAQQIQANIAWGHFMGCYTAPQLHGGRGTGETIAILNNTKDLNMFTAGLTFFF